MTALWRECGRIKGYDERYPSSHDIYDSLCLIVYGLMED